MFLHLFEFVLALRGPTPRHQISLEGKITDDAQHRNTGFDESTMLHADETIPEKVSLRLKTQVQGQVNCIAKTASLPHLQAPQALAQLLAELHVECAFLHLVLAQALSHQAVLETLCELGLLYGLDLRTGRL